MSDDEPEPENLTRKSSTGTGKDDTENDFNDFDDDFDSSGPSSRRETGEDAKVDLNKFLNPKEPSVVEIPVIKVEVTEEPEFIGDFDEVPWDEDEDEYETEEEEMDEEEMEDLGPSDETQPIETSSFEQLRLQQEHNRRMARRKKKELIEEYLTDMQKLHQLQKRNLRLGYKITYNMDENQRVIEKYVQQHKDQMEKDEETERLKRLHLQKSCNPERHRKGSRKHKKKKRGSRKRSSAGAKDQRRARFQTLKAAPSTSTMTTDKSDTSSSQKQTRALTFDVMKTLYANVAKNATRQRMKTIGTKKGEGPLCKLQKRKSSTGKMVSFSFKRSTMLGDVIFPKTELGKRSKLMNITISENSLASRPTQFINPKRQKLLAKRTMRFITKKNRPRFNLTTVARQLAKSKSRMALGSDKQDQKIMLETADMDVDVSNLNHFQFELAEPTVGGRKGAVGLREDVLKILEHRHISTSQLRWPMEIKGLGFDRINPFGRVQLNYTRLSHHEKEKPHTAYRIMLTNIAYFKSKYDRMMDVHKKNQSEMEDELERLAGGLQQFLRDIVDGLRLWASLSGITCRERYDAKQDTEEFIEYLQQTFEFVLLERYAHLYKSIHACEFALRRLALSEGKGEGAQLHEFKDLMRCREKLKAEHRTIQKFIMRYQRHSQRVLANVRKTDARMHRIEDTTTEMGIEIKRLKGLVRNVTEGLYFCQGITWQNRKIEKELRSKLGIYAYPAVMDDYEKTMAAKETTRAKRAELTQKYNGVVRQIYKMSPKCFNSIRRR